MRHWRVHPCYWILSLVLCFYFFLQLQVWRKLHSGGGDNGDVSIWPLSSSTTKSKRLEMPTCPLIDTISLKNGLVCIEKCTPHTNNTLEGMGLDPYEMIRISPAQLHVSSMIYLISGFICSFDSDIVYQLTTELLHIVYRKDLIYQLLNSVNIESIFQKKEHTWILLVNLQMK